MSPTPPSAGAPHPERRAEPVLWLLVAAAVVLVGRFAYLRMFNIDEIEAVHSAWLVREGGVPYRDFFQHHHPGLYWLLAPLVAVLGEEPGTVLACRGTMYLFGLGVIALTWRLGLSLHGRRGAVVAALLLATSVLFSNNVFEVRPDVPMTFFGIASVLFLVRQAETGRRLHLVASAVCAGLAFLCLQKFAFVLAGLAAIGLVRVLRREARWVEFWLWGAAFVATLAPAVAFLALEGALSRYLFLCWRLNLPVEGGFGPWKEILWSLQANTLTWLGLACAWPRLRTVRHQEILVLAACALTLVFLAHRPWTQYYLLAMPLVALVAAGGIEWIFERRPQAMLALVVVGSLPVLGFWALDDFRTNRRQLDCIAYVLEVTDEDDHVHDGLPRFNVFRRDLDWFWFSLKPGQVLDRYRLVRDYDYDVTKRVVELRPRILSGLRIDMEDPRIRESYAPVPGFPSLRELKRP